MLTYKELEACLPIRGAYPMALLIPYYGLVLKKELTSEDVLQIIAHWDAKYKVETP